MTLSDLHIFFSSHCSFSLHFSFPLHSSLLVLFSSSLFSFHLFLSILSSLFPLPFLFFDLLIVPLLCFHSSSFTSPFIFILHFSLFLSPLLLSFQCFFLFSLPLSFSLPFPLSLLSFPLLCALFFSLLLSSTLFSSHYSFPPLSFLLHVLLVWCAAERRRAWRWLGCRSPAISGGILVPAIAFSYNLSNSFVAGRHKWKRSWAVTWPVQCVLPHPWQNAKQGFWWVPLLVDEVEQQRVGKLVSFALVRWPGSFQHHQITKGFLSCILHGNDRLRKFFLKIFES